MPAINRNNTRPKRLRRRKGTRANAPYLTFGLKSTICLGIFVFVYAISMMFFQPALKDEAKAQRIKAARDKLVKRKQALVGHVRSEGHAWKEEFKQMKNHVHIRKKEAVEQNLMDGAYEQLLKQKKKEERLKKQTKPTTGFMVLGMHRSGTSMLSGLLVEGFGYTVGEPVIPPSFDNEKGFFELIPAVLANDYFMYEQNVNWAANVIKYDHERALQATKEGKVKRKELDKALAVLNDPKNSPWLQKDPRMCITMRTWLPYLDSTPAVLFTYRHPLEVAMSLHKREDGFTIARGLRLWILYNKGAVLNSADLCRVLSSNNKVLADPLGETKRIVKELEECGVPAASSTITQDVVDGFVDPKLQHNKKGLDEEKKEKEILATYGDCVVRDYDSEAEGVEKKREMRMYKMAMKIYCDLESGIAYDGDYDWPDLEA